MTAQLKSDGIVHNAAVADHLEAIALYEKILKIDKYEHRSRSYLTAAKLLRTIDHEVITSEEAFTYKGIGEKIAQVIEEFARTGTSKRLEELRKQAEDRESYIKLFTSIYDIGIVKANKLYDENIRNLRQLENSKLLTRSQLLGLKYRERFLEKIPRTEIKNMEKRIRDILLPYGFLIIVVGSYRRGAEQSNDIDVLVTHDNAFVTESLSNVIIHLSSVLLHTLKLGKRSYSGITTTERRIDIKLFKNDEYPTALMHFTGSARFNANTRKTAGELGLKLNEYELIYKNTNKKITVKSERDIFNALGMEYLPPTYRN
jgi:DNA polymerase/3'-5' exonuclease PolX